MLLECRTREVDVAMSMILYRRWTCYVNAKLRVIEQRVGKSALLRGQSRRSVQLSRIEPGDVDFRVEYVR